MNINRGSAIPSQCEADRGACQSSEGKAQLQSVPSPCPLRHHPLYTPISTGRKGPGVASSHLTDLPGVREHRCDPSPYTSLKLTLARST